MRILFLVVSLFVFNGCSVKQEPLHKTETEALATLLWSLDKNIPLQEAQYLSKDIFAQTDRLAKTFKLTSPPLFHNFLVHIGLRKKGLCYHWSDALYLYFYRRGYTHFEFHLAGANIGNYFYEHNALVVTAKDGLVEEGIVIDPWRNSGKLYFSKVKEDKKYLWKHREERGC